MFGYSPPRLLAYLPGTTMVDAMDIQLKQREQVLQLLKENLQRSRNKMKRYADLKHTEREFKEGDWVYLRLQPYRQVSVAWQRNLKLSPCFYGPFLVLSRVGAVAYKLELPLGSLIHPVFHVSQLKLKLGRAVTPLIHLSLVNPAGVIQA